MNYPGGHKLRPYFPNWEWRLDDTAHMICKNCTKVDPEPGSDCTDDQ